MGVDTPRQLLNPRQVLTPLQPLTPWQLRILSFLDRILKWLGIKSSWLGGVLEVSSPHQARDLTQDAAKECSVQQRLTSRCDEYTPIQRVCNDESTGQSWLGSVTNWGKARMEDCRTSILQMRGLCGITSLVVARVVWGVCHSVRSCLDSMWRRWRDKEKRVQEVQDRDLTQDAAKEYSVQQHLTEFTPTLSVCDDDKSTGQSWLSSISNWWMTTMEACRTSILQMKGWCRVNCSISFTPRSAASAMLCRAWVYLQLMLWHVFWYVRLLVTATSLVVARVVWGICHSVRRCLDGMLRRWRDKERRVQEVQDRDLSEDVAEKFVSESRGEFKDLQKLPDLGSRLQKYWFRARTREDAEVIIAVIKVSARCPVDLVKDIYTISKKLFPDIQGPYLQPVLAVEYFQEEGQLVIVQPFHEMGSLRDLVYQKPPTKDWSQKYYTYSDNPPPTHLIAQYGRQILKGVLYLYELGFEQVGQIHSGNVFLDGDICRLGGFENTVFGYKTRLTTLLHDYREAMDLIMFGHVMFEMACGYELTTVMPSEEDWGRVRSSAVLDVLQFIFHTDKKGQFTSTIKTVLRHEFFSCVESSSFVPKPHLPRMTNRSVKVVLSKVNKGARSQGKSRRCKVQ